MVFHDIERISDVLKGHRIIIYYILSQDETKLHNYVENVMKMLQKKNDDIVIFRVLQNTTHFNHFKDLYKPVINGPICLFVVNNEGIPMVCKEITQHQNIPDAFESICNVCKLKRVSITDIRNVINNKDEVSSNKTGEMPTGKNASSGEGKMTNDSIMGSFQTLSSEPVLDGDPSIEYASRPTLNDGPSKKVEKYSSARLQIRLPDGRRDNQKFDKDALLQEVHDLIHMKYKMSNFDLKTYNRQVFTAADYQKTLEELDLIPNGVIIIVLRNVSPNSYGGISGIFHFSFWNFLARTTSVFHYIHGIFFMFWNSFFGSTNVRSSQNRPSSQENSSARETRSSNGNRKTVGVYRQYGNIHTLKRSDDSDDENNRYNGNSTQQK